MRAPHHAGQTQSPLRPLIDSIRTLTTVDRVQAQLRVAEQSTRAGAG